MPGPNFVVTDESGSRPKIFQNQQTTVSSDSAFSRLFHILTWSALIISAL